MKNATNLPELLARFERRIIIREIKRRCNFTQVAKVLGISRTKLIYRRKILNITEQTICQKCKGGKC